MKKTYTQADFVRWGKEGRKKALKTNKISDYRAWGKLGGRPKKIKNNA